MICIHCEHKFIGGAFVRGSGPGTSVAMRRCPKCNKEFVAPPRPRAPGKIVALAAENDALRATVERLEAERQTFIDALWENGHDVHGQHTGVQDGRCGLCSAYDSYVAEIGTCIRHGDWMRTAGHGCPGCNGEVEKEHSK